MGAGKIFLKVCCFFESRVDKIKKESDISNQYEIKRHQRMSVDKPSQVMIYSPVIHKAGCS